MLLHAIDRDACALSDHLERLFLGLLLGGPLGAGAGDVLLKQQKEFADGERVRLGTVG